MFNNSLIQENVIFSKQNKKSLELQNVKNKISSQKIT